MSRKLSYGLFLLLFWVSCAHAETPATPAKQVDVGRKGTFYLGILAPFPATFGLGLTHYFRDYLGFTIELGKGVGVVYAGGVKLRPYSGKVSPIVGLNASLADEAIDAPRGHYYFNTGFDWKWDGGMFLHFGINWTITKVDGASAMKPYIQFGLHY